VRVRHLPAREHTRAATLYPPASIPVGEKSCPCPHPADIRGYRVYPHPPPLPFSTCRCSCLPHAPPLPWALPPPLLHASWPSKPARPPRPRPSSSLSWPPPPPCRGRHQIRPPLLTSLPAHECLSSSARAPVPVHLPRRSADGSGADDRRGVELEGRGPVRRPRRSSRASRRRPVCEREANWSLEKRLRETWEAAAAAARRWARR
jgi:hypothetical protein